MIAARYRPASAGERDEHQTDDEGDETKADDAGGGEPAVGEAIDDRPLRPQRVMTDVYPRACRQRSRLAAGI
ncbi:MAG: hypothetical protein FAZ92_02339 [Accumulibacter sp.]|jgi:hypothetical protein|nr:MAG: hypothetical protein FAZ92_02339 [Accumulibacter sp.]